MNQTLRVLSLPEVGLQAVVPSCAADYQRELYSLMRARTLSGTPPPPSSPPQQQQQQTSTTVAVCSGDNRSPWVRVQLDDGLFFFLHLSRLEGSWEEPSGFVNNSVFLDRHQIQVRRT